MTNGIGLISCLTVLVMGLPNSTLAGDGPSPQALQNKADYFEAKTDAMITPQG